MTLISQETLKELDRIIENEKYPVLNLDTIKQLIHDAKVARVAVKLRDARFMGHYVLCKSYAIGNAKQCTCGLSDILKELDELEKE